MSHIKIVIIEDELLTAEDLKNTLISINEKIEVLEIIQSVSEGVEYFSKHHDCDLIFSDIKLGDGLSFEILEHLYSDIPVVFCTAYNDYAIEAFQSNGIDYILKPFSEEAVYLAIEKFQKSILSTSKISQELSQLVKQMVSNKQLSNQRILVEKGRRSVPLAIHDIGVVFIEDRVIFGVTLDGQRHLLSGTLESVHETLGGEFYRANRKFIVQRKAVKEVHHTEDRKIKLILQLAFKEDIFIGKMKSKDFLKWLVK